MSYFLDHASPDYQCSDLTPCPYTGQELLTRHRLGAEEEHRLWDRREEIRDGVEEIVKTVVGEELAADWEFINRLLIIPEFLNTLQTIRGQNDRAEGNNDDQSEPGYCQQREEQNKKKILSLFGLIREEKLFYEKETDEQFLLRQKLKILLKEMLNDENYSDPAMTSTLLNSEDIRTWLTVFGAAEDEEQRGQARRALAGVIRDTQGAERLRQR